MLLGTSTRLLRLLQTLCKAAMILFDGVDTLGMERYSTGQALRTVVALRIPLRYRCSRRAHTDEAHEIQPSVAATAHRDATALSKLTAICVNRCSAAYM